MTLKNDKAKILMFVLSFNMLWLIRVFFVPKTQVENIDLTVTIALKFLIFVVFPYLYIKFIYKENPIVAFKFNTDIKKGFLYGLVGSVAIVILGVIVYFTSNGTQSLKGLNFQDLFFIFIFAALFEEIAFKGLILNKLNVLMSFGKANIVTALLFVFIHMPQYIMKGTFTSQVALNSFIIIFIWGIIGGYIFKKSNSIWSIVIVHGIWDCAVHVLGF